MTALITIWNRDTLANWHFVMPNTSNLAFCESHLAVKIWDWQFRVKGWKVKVNVSAGKTLQDRNRYKRFWTMINVQRKDTLEIFITVTQWWIDGMVSWGPKWLSVWWLVPSDRGPKYTTTEMDCTDRSRDQSDQGPGPPGIPVLKMQNSPRQRKNSRSVKCLILHALTQ